MMFPSHRILNLVTVFPVFSIVFLFLSFSANAQTWEKPYPGNDPTTLYYPDQNAVYFRYGWENKGTGILIIKGQLPKARYYSYNLYDDRTKGSLVALADYEIKADGQNNGAYTIYVVPEKLKGDFPNQIVLPDSVRFTSVFLRYYLPEGGILAGAPTPTLEWKEGETTRPAPPGIAIPTKNSSEAKALEQLIRSDPNRITNDERELLASSTATPQQKERIICKVMTVPIFKHVADPQVLSAFNYNSSGNYPNKDNHYIVMPVNLKKNNVLVVRWKAPTYATQQGDTSKEVRYYSLSQGNEYTNTSITLHDEQLRVSEDGFVYVAVAEDDQEIRSRVKDMNINFMPLLYKERIVLILRHMLPSSDFRNSAREVPAFDNKRPASGQEAQKTMGDYALVGKFIKSSDWKSLTRVDQLGF